MDLEAALAKVKEFEATTADLTAQLEALKKNNEALVGEKRTVAEQKRQFEEEARLKAEELAKKNGDFESLVQTAKEKEAAALKKLEEKEQEIANEKIGNMATKLANEIAFDSDAASLLEEQFAKRLIFEDNQVKIKPKEGSTVSTFDQLKEEFIKTSRYKALVKGSQASGGRPFNANGGAGNQTDTTRKLSPVERLNRERGAI